MNQKKIRVLGIAPYNGMRNIMKNLADSRDDLDATVYVGNLQSGIQIVKQHSTEDFDVIISRGGTAELLRSVSPIPVIEIQLSVYDILRAIKLADGSSSKYAIVGFPGITSPAHLLCDLFHFDIEIITIYQEEEALIAMNSLRQRDCHFVLCDVIADTIARQAGLTPILITSGTESINAAFDQAVQLYSGFSLLREKNFLMEEALKNHSGSTIVMRPDGTVLFSSCQTEDSIAVTEYLRNLVQNSKNLTTSKSFHFIDHSLYALSIRHITYEEKDFFLFCIEPNPVPSESGKYGLRFSNCTEMKNMYFNSFYSLTTGAASLGSQITQINLTTLPVMILGESGTGKNQAAARLYIESEWNTNPYITIDCQLLNKRNWEFLTRHYNSPFCDTGNTIFISNIQSLSPIQQKQLLSLMLDTNLHKRNRLLISCSQTLENEDSDPSRDFINYLPCTTLYMPPLRELTEDLPSSSNLYLNALNIELSKQIVGFEPEALKALCAYDWPDNFMQLKRVLAELVMLTTTPYILASTVKKTLEKESQQYAPAPLPDTSFNYDRPLDEMIRDLVQVVVDQCGGNQTLAAKKLKIGRTTIWRYLK